MKLRTTLPCLSLCLLASVVQPALAFFPAGENNFADAPPFSTQSDVSFSTFINVYGTEPNEPSHLPNLANGSGKTAWWKWIAPENGFCTVDTIHSVYIGSPVLDTVLSVYTGTALNDLTRGFKQQSHD